MVATSPEAPPTAEDVFNVSKAYMDCGDQNLKRLLRTEGTPDQISDQVLSACTTYEQNLRAIIVAFSPNLGSERVDQVIDHAKSKVRNKSIETMTLIRQRQGQQ